LLDKNNGSSLKHRLIPNQKGDSFRKLVIGFVAFYKYVKTTSQSLFTRAYVAICSPEKRKVRDTISPRNFVPPNNPNADAGSVPGFHSGAWQNQRGDTGKVLQDDNEPGISTHLHQHPDGLTISTYRDGKPPERFTFGRD
jgi:hypothetical protein